MLLGILGGGQRLRAGIAAALDIAPSLSAPRPLDAADYALLGLLGFHHRIEELLHEVAPATQATTEASDNPDMAGSSLRDLLR